jgi:hypothetical protein
MGGPYFIPDIYEPTFSGLVPYQVITADPRFVGCILKATQGVQYAPAWFIREWPRAKAAGGSRYGSTWFRGTYHFGMPTARGDVQADFCLNHLDKAGGFDPAGDMPIAWDLENSSNTTWQSAQQIVDISSQFAERVRARTGRAPVLYAGALIRDLGIKHHMGFGKLWTPHLDMSKAGWSLGEYCLWQYAGGKGFYNPAYATLGYPTSLAGWGSTDMNVVMDGGGVAGSTSSVQSALTGGGLLPLLLLGAASVFAYLYWRR